MATPRRGYIQITEYSVPRPALAGAPPPGPPGPPGPPRRRGIVGETLSASDALAIGRAFGTIVSGAGGRRVALGFDGRLSSPELEQALGEGLQSTGLEVLRIGLGPTPMLYFAVHHLGADGGIQVTGSDNPPSHNGFKMMLGHRPFCGEQIQELGRIAAEGSFASGPGRLVDEPVAVPYVDRLVQDYTLGRDLSVVWDAGNGAAGEIMQAVIARLPGNHTPLFADIDGRFPNHHPDPTIPENLAALIAKVECEGAEVGIAFDGDGDRIGVVDGRGRILFGDQLLQILATEVLEQRPGSPIIADVKASEALFDRIRELGGQPDMHKTGHSLINARMVELGAPLAGEMGGHVFYGPPAFYGHDDALYVAVRLLGILAAGERTLADWYDGMARRVKAPEIPIECPGDCNDNRSTVYDWDTDREPLSPYDIEHAGFIYSVNEYARSIFTEDQIANLHEIYSRMLGFGDMPDDMFVYFDVRGDDGAF